MEITTVSWDLSDLFCGHDDPRIDRKLDELDKQAEAFAKTYRGTIDSPELTAAHLAKAISEYEEIAKELTKPAAYAALLFSSDTSKHEYGALMQRVQEKQTQTALKLLFFELELMAARPDAIDCVLKDDAISEYRHFVVASRLFREHRLSEQEETILEEKANTGSRAFERLFEEVTSAIEFQVTVNGEVKTVNESEVLAMLRDHDRDTRKAAAASLTEGLVRNGRILTFIFNTLVFDKSVDDRLRSYDHPEQARNTANELDKETVETVISVCAENYPLVARYYQLKKQILGYDTLTHYDRYAPIFESHVQYAFDDARDTVLDSFGGFSKEIEEAAAEFFARNWIDAEPRDGKRSGAFCMYVTPDLHPYVLMNYLNRKDDIMTLGHELGHGVHAYLSRVQTHLNQSSALPVAELASTFGEMLVFENLVAESDMEEKLALYAEKIESVFATVFRQAAMYKFEQGLHQARRTQGELTPEQIGEIWQEQIQSMFGDSVELGDEHKNWWMYVGHFISSPFYVYAYSFGELLVMALYSMYRREGAAFVPKYLDLLKTGGSCSPEELLARVGIDIKDRKFWEGGVRVVEQLVADFEKLHKQWKNAV